MNKVSELRPFQKRVELAVKVLEKNEVREVTSKLDNSSHKVTEVLVGDDSGAILLTLWDEMIDKVEVDKSYKIANGYTSLFKNSLRLNIGRYGELTDSEEEVSEVNKENNISDQEFEQRRRFGGNRDFGNRKPRQDNSDDSSQDSSSDSTEETSTEATEETKEVSTEEATEAPAETETTDASTEASEAPAEETAETTTEEASETPAETSEATEETKEADSEESEKKE